MGMLLEMLKWIFFFLTVLIGLFFLRGQVIVGPAYYDIVRQIVMPGYLLFCGCMIGYIISRIRMGYDDEIEYAKKNMIYTRSFIIGISIGIVLAVIYIFI